MLVIIILSMSILSIFRIKNYFKVFFLLYYQLFKRNLQLNKKTFNKYIDFLI